MELLSLFWNNVIINPMLNTLVLLYVVLWNNFGIAILAFTLLVRILTLPLTIKQIKQTQALSKLQPRMAEIRKKYPKDTQKQSQETMRLYKEAGVNPLGCLGPMIVQMPIFFGLYRALDSAVKGTPDSTIELSQRLYSWLPGVNEAVPLNSHFLWMDLALPDPLPVPVLAILVGVTTWVSQKMVTPASMGGQQQQQQAMMQWMLPVMLSVFTMGLASGLALYWIATNVIGVAIQYPITGFQPLFRRSSVSAPAPAAVQEPPAPTKESEDGTAAGTPAGNERANGRRSNRNRSARARRQQRRG